MACDLAADYGLTADGWQRGVLDDWLRETSGRWASLTCGLSVPRQNGKNAILEIRELFGLIGRGERILHTAHEMKTAQKHFRRLKHFFGKKAGDGTAVFPELNALVETMRSVNGQEAIFLTNGGSVEIIARSQGSGRGFTVDTIVCDEAQDMRDDDLEAILSTSSAGPQGNPQWIFTGTPPSPRVSGSVFSRIRTEALTKDADATEAARLTWHEWSADDDADLDDQAQWQQANPALGIRIALDVVQGERARFSDAGFGRERLGMWPPAEEFLAVVPAEMWQALKADGPADGVAPTALAVDASHDRTMAIAGCWADPADDAVYVELLELGYAGDTVAVAQWLTQRAARQRIPVIIDSLSPAASMIPALKAARVNVVQTIAGDMAKACGLIYDDIYAGRLAHGGQRQLADALAGAKRRSIGGAGGWGWDRKDPDANIAPLVAVTLARFGAAAYARRRRAKGINGRTISNRRGVLV